MEQLEDLRKADPAADVDRISPLPIPGDPDPGPALAALDQAIALAEARLDQLRAARAHVDALLSVRLQPALPGIDVEGEVDQGVDVSAEVEESLSQAERFGRRLARLGVSGLSADPDDEPPPADEPIDAGVTEDDDATVEAEAPATEPQADPPEGEGSAPAPDTSTDPPADPAGATRLSPRQERRDRKREERERRDAQRAKSDHAKRDEQVLAYIVEHPGTNGSDVARALEFHQSQVSQITIRLARQDKIKREKVGIHVALFANDGPRPDEMAPSDDDGAKTGLERQVLEACRERPMTLGGLAVKLKVRQDRLADVCAGLVRREPPVLVRIHKPGEAQARFRPARGKGSADG